MNKKGSKRFNEIVKMDDCSKYCMSIRSLLCYLVSSDRADVPHLLPGGPGLHPSDNKDA